jgi:AcrR family transcriptional regulator
MPKTTRPKQQRLVRPTDVDQLSLASLRRRPSQRRGAQRVIDVLDAFEQLLVRKRCEEITMEDLSRTAGIQIGSLYHFFPDITSVILTVLERALADEAAAFERSPEDEGSDFTSYLDAIERQVTTVWRQHGPLMGVFFAYQRHPLIWNILRLQRERTAAIVGAKLRELAPALGAARALELGRMIGVTMAVLVDNLEFLPPTESRRLRREFYLMLCRHVAAEGVPTDAAPVRRAARRPAPPRARRVSRGARAARS